LSDYKLLALIVKEIQKLKQEREAYAAAGRCDNIEEYRRICGIILGLNYAENIIEDLVQKMEKADD
jgi:hypothetical protein